MLRKILLPTDFSDRARAAYAAAVSIAREFDATLLLVHEAEPVPPLYFEHVSPDFPVNSYYEGLERRLDAESGHVVFEECRVETRLLRGESEDERIVDLARDEGVDLVVLSTHGRSGLAHVMLGSFAERLARTAPVPVLTYRRRDEREKFAPRAAVVPFDFSDNATAILPLARFFARHFGTRLTLLHVLPDPDEFSHGRFGAGTSYAEIQRDTRQAREAALRQLEEFCAREFPRSEIARARVRQGPAYREIIHEAQESRTDLILMATHGFSGLRHFFFGSVAEKVLRGAPCSVLTIRPEEVKTTDAGETAVSSSSSSGRD